MIYLNRLQGKKITTVRYVTLRLHHLRSSSCWSGSALVEVNHYICLQHIWFRRITVIVIYYPTAPRRVQITPKTSTNIMRYLYSRGPVRQVCLLLTNQLAGFPAPISFRFAYFCHGLPVNKYPRNSTART